MWAPAGPKGLKPMQLVYLTPQAGLSAPGLLQQPVHSSVQALAQAHCSTAMAAPATARLRRAVAV